MSYHVIPLGIRIRESLYFCHFNFRINQKTKIIDEFSLDFFWHKKISTILVEKRDTFAFYVVLGKAKQKQEN